MKKNEKGFMQEDKILENVSGGAMSGIETEVKTGDISIGYQNTQQNKIEHSHNVSTSKNPKLEGNITINGNFSL